MRFTCRLGLHKHHSEEKANRCEKCAAGTRRYFKVISDAMLVAQGVPPLPHDYHGDGDRMVLAQNVGDARRKRARRNAV